MKLRNLFKSKIEGKVSEDTNFQILKMLNSYTPFFMSDISNIYDNLLIRSCIDTVAKQGAKLKAKVKGPNSTYKKRLEYLLVHRPNKFMSAYDFLYKVISMYLTNNNAFVFINYDYETQIEGLYPIPYSQIEFLEYKKELYCKFFFKSGTSPVILPYEDLIHLRRHFNQEDITGSGQNEVLRPVLSLFKSVIEGFVNSVRATSVLRGYLKYTGNISQKTLNEYKQGFVDSYMNIANADGIGALDSKAEFHELKITPYTIDSKNQELANKQIYTYYGVSQEILTGKYSEEQYNAFYNSTIEPIAIQFSNEFTNKLFSEKEIQNGREIVFSSLRLIFANNTTKANIIKEMMPLGVFSFNDARNLYELDPVDDGDKRLISLNYVNALKADEYQGVEDNKKDTKKDEENDKTDNSKKK